MNCLTSMIQSSTGTKPSRYGSQRRAACELHGRFLANMDSRLTVQLSSEHTAIWRELGRLRRSSRRFETDHPFRDAMFLTQFAESVNEHFKREEQLLLPLLSRSLGSKLCDRLKNEQTEIRNVVRQLAQQTRPVQESFRHLEQLMRTHISTEENVLFWYLDVQRPEESQ
jgi:hemerythrin-like domain-containing protein